jgi:hypothetical protein
MTVQVNIGLITTEGSRNTWLLNVLATSATPAPQLRIQRLLPVRPGRKPPAADAAPVAVSTTPPPSGFVAEGSLTVTEQDRVNKSSLDPIAGSAGEVDITLSSAPTGESSQFGWDVELTTRVDKGLQLLVFARDGSGKFVQVGSVSGTVFAPAQINAQTAQTVRAIVKPVPRLSVGLIQAPVPTIPAKYRGVSVPGGNANQFGAGPTVPNLEALLQRIFFLLDAPGTLNPVWDSEAGTSSAELASRAAQPTVDAAVAEELWARQVAEMLLGVPYDSPESPYNSGRPIGQNRLANLPFCGAQLGAKEPNPIYGIPFACQHLATFGILSRGEYTSKFELGAGSMVSGTVTGMKRDSVAAKWFVNSAAPIEITNAQALKTNLTPDVLTPEGLQVDLTEFIKLPDYGPGSVHLFSNARVRESSIAYEQIQASLALNPVDPKTHLVPGLPTDAGSKFFPAVDKKKNPIVTITGAQCRYLMKIKITSGKVETNQLLCFPTGLDQERDNQGAAHIGFTLRVRNGKAQFFDTGGLNAPNRQTPEVSELFPLKKGLHGGTMDDALGVQCRSLASPFRGVGMFGKLKPENAKRLADHVNTVLKRARPMGLARLYLLQANALQASSVTGNFPPVTVNQVLYASPLKPMYDSDTTPDADRKESDPLARNYAISRYAWSLRGLTGNFQAVWVIYVPLAPLIDTMLTSGRSSVVKNIGSGVVAQTKVVRGVMNQSDGGVTLLDPEALAPLTRLEGRGLQATTQIALDVAFTPKPVPNNVAQYFQDV